MTPEQITLDHEHRQSAEGMVYHSFLRSYRSAVSRALVTDSRYYKVLHDDMENHLKRCKLFVAPLPGFDDEWAGWAMGNGAEIVWIYVKEAFRDQGVSTALLRAMLEARAVWYRYHGSGAEPYLDALEKALNVRLRYSPAK